MTELFASTNDVKLSRFLTLYSNQYYWIPAAYATTWVRGRAHDRAKGCSSWNIYAFATESVNIVWASIPLDAIGYTFRRKGGSKTQAAALLFRLNQFSLFITGNCFSILLSMGNNGTFGLRCLEHPCPS